MDARFEQWLERAAILEYDAGLDRSDAEETAARQYGWAGDLASFREKASSMMEDRR